STTTGATTRITRPTTAAIRRRTDGDQRRAWDRDCRRAIRIGSRRSLNKNKSLAGAAGSSKAKQSTQSGIRTVGLHFLLEVLARRSPPAPSQDEVKPYADTLCGSDGGRPLGLRLCLCTSSHERVVAPGAWHD